MTLHEAIIKVLNESAKSTLSTTQIADILNAKKYYIKKDKSQITASQIHRRTNNHKKIFCKNRNLVSLFTQNSTQHKKPIEKSILNRFQKTSVEIMNLGLLEKVLLNEKNFKTCQQAEYIISDSPGIYCIRIKAPEDLPEIFSKELKSRNHNIIYFGIASQSLNKRFFNQELRAKGHGTFFRSIGAVLNFKPPKGSLKEKLNKRNYKFHRNDEIKIINWINKNLLINWIEKKENIEEFETYLIVKYKPLLNISKNPYPMPEVSALRAECVRIANK